MKFTGLLRERTEYWFNLGLPKKVEYYARCERVRPHELEENLAKRCDSAIRKPDN